MAEYTLLRLKGELPDITGKVIDPDALLPGAVVEPVGLDEMMRFYSGRDEK